MTEYYIAQINVAVAVDDLDSPALKDFVENLDRINALAEAQPGFVWRLRTELGNATDVMVGDDPRFIVNMSVWGSVEALFDYVYKSGHTKIMARRREFFERPASAYQAMWWVPAGHVPTIEEGMSKLALIDRVGPSRRAFTFKKRFPAHRTRPPRTRLT